MDKKIIIFITFVFLFVYLTGSVPLCTPPGGESKSEIKVTANITLLHISGESMFPTIKDDSMCLCVEEEKYFVGDIIVFVNEKGNSISHRISSIGEEKIFTKGDNNEFLDPSITREDIVCRISTTTKYNVLFKSFI